MYVITCNRQVDNKEGGSTRQNNNNVKPMSRLSVINNAYPRKHVVTPSARNANRKDARRRRFAIIYLAHQNKKQRSRQSRVPRPPSSFVIARSKRERERGERRDSFAGTNRQTEERTRLAVEAESYEGN